SVELVWPVPGEEPTDVVPGARVRRRIRQGLAIGHRLDRGDQIPAPGPLQDVAGRAGLRSRARCIRGGLRVRGAGCQTSASLSRARRLLHDRDRLA
ncbi:MAG TPA: hypothetical protein VL400_02515, partial [Polyangiaceae bacterium]|nr:hypothetical protein [Polyangiaceae bacterium]